MEFVDRIEEANRLKREVLSKMIALIIPGSDKVIYPNWNVLFDTLNDRTTNKFA